MGFIFRNGRGQISKTDAIGAYAAYADFGRRAMTSPGSLRPVNAADAQDQV